MCQYSSVAELIGEKNGLVLEQSKALRCAEMVKKFFFNLLRQAHSKCLKVTCKMGFVKAFLRIAYFSSKLVLHNEAVLKGRLLKLFFALQLATN